MHRFFAIAHFQNDLANRSGNCMVLADDETMFETVEDLQAELRAYRYAPRRSFDWMRIGYTSWRIYQVDFLSEDGTHDAPRDITDDVEIAA